MQKSTTFQKTIEQARNKLKYGQHETAARLYRQAITIDFVADLDCWEQYYDAKIHMSTALKNGKEFAKGRAILQGVIRQMEGQDIDERLPNRRNVMKFKSSAMHNLAKLQLAFSYQFKAADDKEYISYRKALNSAHQLFGDSLMIIVEMLSKWIERGQELNEWWHQEYFKIKSNYMEVLIQEGEEFEDRSCFQAIIEDADRARKFYKYRPSQKAEIHLYRCYYSKSIALRILGREEQSYKLLLEDYEFQRQHNQFNDAQKSRSQLLRYCLDKNMLNEGRRYVKDKDGEMIFNQIVERRKRMMAHFGQKQEVLRNYTKDFYGELLSDIDNQYNCYAYDFSSTEKYLQDVIGIYNKTQQLQSCLYYYLAVCSFYLKDYLKAERMIGQALKIPSKDKIQQRDNHIHQLRVRSKIASFRQGFMQRYNELIREINIMQKKGRNQEQYNNLQTQKNGLIQIYQQFNKHEMRAKEPVNYSFANSQENKMIVLLQKGETKDKPTLRVDVRQRSQQICIFHEDGEGNKPKRLIFNPQQQYTRKCAELGIQQRSQIRQSISKGSFNLNPFINCYNMCPQELQLLLPLLKMQNLDLRKQMLNNQCLQSIAHHVLVRSFKLSGANNLQNRVILKTVSKMCALNYLSFVDFPSTKHRSFDELDKDQLRSGRQSGQTQPRSLIHTILLLKYVPNSQFDPLRLRTLKLKYCNLEDDHLRLLDFSLFQNLEEVSLSHNMLQGRELASIIIQTRVNKLNLSDNPLSSLSFQAWSEKIVNSNFYIKQLKMREIDFTEQLGREVSCVLEKTKCFDVSQSRFLWNLITPAWNNYLDGRCFDLLKEWTMKNVDLDTIKLEQLIGLLSSCHSLQKTDLRFCKHNYDLQYSIKELGSNLNIWLSSTDYNVENDCFDLPPPNKHH